ncbi:hypothetical protein ABEB36_004228 [Hypothenemus hampei]|uniref:Uncharacterized protein n=1 Tax=Hypothenemus hampei TaxID=57062 RepID=A0ABD1F2N5_HYPHA
MSNLHLEIAEPLDIRVAKFKNDPEKLQEVNDFLNDVFETAEKLAEKRQSTLSKSRLTGPKKSEHGQTVLDRLPECLRLESLPPYVTVPIQCGVVLLLATIIIKKYLWSHPGSTN